MIRRHNLGFIMRVFLTGATGFIGSHIVPELIKNGHDVLGLTRSDAGATQLEQAGAIPYRGTLEDPSSLARGAAEADAVIHTAFDHAFSGAESFVANIKKDRQAITAIGEELAGSPRPFIITSGLRYFLPGSEGWHKRPFSIPHQQITIRLPIPL